MMSVLVCNVSRYGYSIILWSVSEIPNKMVVLVSVFTGTAQELLLRSFPEGLNKIVVLVFSVYW